MQKFIIKNLFLEQIPVSSLLLSTFSHSSIVHLGFNMYALHTFCRGNKIYLIIIIYFNYKN